MGAFLRSATAQILMTENEITPPATASPIELGYAPPPTDAAGPSLFQVFAGTVSLFLGLFPLAAGLSFLWLAAGALFHFKALGKTRAPLPLSGFIGLAFGAAFCFCAAKVMFDMARRLFRGKRNTRLGG
jgi:hypothetical protein